jgi:hypothetical protein
MSSDKFGSESTEIKNAPVAESKLDGGAESGEGEGVEEEEEEDPNLIDGVWHGRCLDDGTGRDVYYLGENGNRSRRQPVGYIPEYLDNGDRRYYFRKQCIRCRKKDVPAHLLSYERGAYATSFNYCADCLKATTTPSISRVLGNGDKIVECNIDTPKNVWIDLKASALSETRDKELLARAVEARYETRMDMKLDRNRQRRTLMKQEALQYEGIDVQLGTHISWGFEDIYDEYFGAVNKDGEPHGYGLKIFSDGTIYFGGFAHGLFHTEDRGNLVKPNGATYEGTWLQGLKHGKGTQIYPDGGRYDGEFAKGYEHGQGKKQYADGSVHEGRFRFGRKDGPGVFTDKDGNVKKGQFLDPTEKYNEKAPPLISEETNEDEVYFQPESLLTLSIQQLAKAMHKNRKKYGPAPLLQEKVPEHLKYPLGKEYLRIMDPKGSESFNIVGPEFAFNFREEVLFQGVRMIEADAQALMYFQNSNRELKTLKCTANKLNLPSLDLICKNIINHAWPQLRELDLSFNVFDQASLESLMAGISTTSSLQYLRLAACGIKPNGFLVIARRLKTDKQIQDLDLAFNAGELTGAEAMADMLQTNKALTSLNLRSNKVGPIGGRSLVDAMSHNKVLKRMCLTDNYCGGEVISEISAKLNGSFRDVLDSANVKELNMPPWYEEGRFDSFKRRMEEVLPKEEESDDD